MNNNFENSYLVQFNDWISSVKYFEDSTFCILTAHNFAVHLKLVVDSETIESDISQTKCLIKLIADTMKSYICLLN